MKWRIAAFLLCSLSLLGCNNEVQAPAGKDHVTLRTAGGEVVVGDVQRDVHNQVLSARVEGSQIDATLSILPAGDGTATVGGRAMLTAASGELLFLLEITMDQNTGEVAFREETDRDYLVFSILEKDDSIVERYDANGDEATFAYPGISEDARRHAANLLEHGVRTDYLPADVQEYIAQADAFRGYYVAHSADSIRDNPYGELLVELLSSDELGHFLDEGAPGAERSRIIQSFCSAVFGCATLACTIAPGNPVCLACGGASIACQIFNIMTIWIPGWN